MRVYSKSTLRNFWRQHPDVEDILREWYRVSLRARWSTSAEVMANIPNARSIGSNRIVFNIKGNNYRLITLMDYDRKVMYVRFIGTHAEYDRINALEV